MPFQPTGAAAALCTLTVGNVRVDALHAFAGLGLEADIAEAALPPGGGTTEKHVANVRWTPGRAEVGASMGKGLYDWIRASLAGAGNASRDGTFTAADFNGKVISESDFFNAQLTGFSVPRLDAASKEAGHFEVAFEAERVRWSTPGAAMNPPPVRPKPWIVSNFKFEFGGLPCSRIAAIEALRWTCAAEPGDPRDPRGGGTHPGKITIPDLALTISNADYAAWADAAKAWFIDGRHLASDERPATLTLLGPSLRADDVIATLEFKGVGFKSFQTLGTPESGDHVARFRVALYAESMAFALAAYDNA